MKTWPIAAALALNLVACSTPYKPAVFAAEPGASTDFRGIASLLGPAPLDVLMVHGMCTKHEDWGSAALASLFKALGPGTVLAGGDEKPVQVPGTGITVVRQSFQTAQGTVRANALRWSGLTAPLKRQLCYDKTHRPIEPGVGPSAEVCTADAEATPGYPYRRASLNRTLKDGLMNDCLADAIVYQGRARDDINAQMQQAILFALDSSGLQKTGVPGNRAASLANAQEHLVAVTSSLGSKILFDALFKMLGSRDPDTARAADRTVDRTSLVFMRANQMPILALADSDLAGNQARSLAADASGYPPDPLAALAERARRKAPLAPQAADRLQVVAFTDPNDVLSYVLAPSPHARSAGYAAIDVVLSTAPSYFGLVALPQDVHGNYDADEEVQRLIFCGHGEQAACR
ncbi:hypothetical protein [Pseudorhodoferax sp. Leaf267]|uniref:hypothetical protein n=1 Tax=Pseudorhodoferax sp. Leaf267 TaxID=1736316 RepID=UPI000700473E|nr:hypothetical protein [Pseudorhodoferax sp. Leaf267]KQP11813.1 hypothetical protein ASF43_22915 [Pseudorhodoferax sp. Leaf267]